MTFSSNLSKTCKYHGLQVLCDDSYRSKLGWQVFTVTVIHPLHRASIPAQCQKIPSEMISAFQTVIFTTFCLSQRIQFNERLLLSILTFSIKRSFPLHSSRTNIIFLSLLQRRMINEIKWIRKSLLHAILFLTYNVIVRVGTPAIIL